MNLGVAATVTSMVIGVGTILVGTWMFSIKVVRTINGRFSQVAVALARIDERVTDVKADTARAHDRIDELARR